MNSHGRVDFQDEIEQTIESIQKLSIQADSKPAIVFVQDQLVSKVISVYYTNKLKNLKKQKEVLLKEWRETHACLPISSNIMAELKDFNHKLEVLDREVILVMDLVDSSSKHLKFVQEKPVFEKSVVEEKVAPKLKKMGTFKVPSIMTTTDVGSLLPTNELDQPRTPKAL